MNHIQYCQSIKNLFNLHTPSNTNKPNNNYQTPYINQHRTLIRQSSEPKTLNKTNQHHHQSNSNKKNSKNIEKFYILNVNKNKRSDSTEFNHINCKP